jgi:hypothetical protein
MYVDMISTTSSRFTFKGDATSTSLFTVSQTGDIALSGKLYPSDRGTAQYSNYIYYDGSAGAGGDRMRTNASGWGTGSYDFAEMFPSTEKLQPGDIVVIDPQHPLGVKRSSSANQGSLIGIVSTQPGFLTGDNSTGTFPIALAGRVPTKVTTSNGPIAIGDALAASDEPGVAMKATGSTPIVGMALEEYSGSQVSSITAFVNVSWLGNQTSVVTSATAKSKGYARISAGSTSVHISFESIQTIPLVFVTPIDDAGVWWITNRTDTGFDVVISVAQNHDVVFSWEVEATPTGAIRR